MIHLQKFARQIDSGYEDKQKKLIKRLTYGRRNGRREREYEAELEGMTSEYNQWLCESDLVKRGYQKLLKIIDKIHCW